MSKRKEPYYHVTDGEWLQVKMRGQLDQCCDCGLVHKQNYRIRDGKIEVQVFRHGPATGGARRHSRRGKDL